MYPNFVVTHPLPFISLPNESLVQMLSNDMLYDMLSVPQLTLKCSMPSLATPTTSSTPTRSSLTMRVSFLSLRDYLSVWKATRHFKTIMDFYSSHS